LLVLSAIGLAESRRRRRRRANDGKVEGYCANVRVGEKEIVECEGELRCCDEGEKGDGVGVCREECSDGVDELVFDAPSGEQSQAQEQQAKRRRYRRRY